MEFDGLKFSCERNPKRALHFDLFFNFVEGPRGLYVECDYNTDLFDPSTMERWLKHFETLLESIAAAPTEQSPNFPFFRTAERNEIAVKWNDTAVKFEDVGTLQNWFELQVEKTPEARALTSEGKHLTYRELNRRTNQLAHHLKPWELDLKDGWAFARNAPSKWLSR